jgi:hypothetical protein
MDIGNPVLQFRFPLSAYLFNSTRDWITLTKIILPEHLHGPEMYFKSVGLALRLMH